MSTKHKESQQPTNTPLSQTRRSALKKMLVGTSVAAGAAALPDKWAKPIVDKVLVPAHAQTSCATETIAGDIFVNLEGLPASIMIVFDFSAYGFGDGADFTLTTTPPSLVFSRSIPSGDGPPGCTASNIEIEATLSGVDLESLQGTFTGSVQCSDEECEFDLTFSAAAEGNWSGTYSGTLTCCPV